MSTADLPQLASSSAAATTAEETTGGTSASASASTSASASGTEPSSGLPGLATDSSSTASSSEPGITNAPSLTASDAFTPPTGLPTLSGFYSYPAPTVPPTIGAPYLASSSLPQNFVFIVVGAVLAFVALCVLAWRFTLAWSVNRSIKRDAAAAYTPLPDLKKQLHKEENAHDMADLSPQLPKSFNSVPNLFFSPTAQVARQSYAGRPPSQHMPSGHYRDASR